MHIIFISKIKKYILAHKVLSGCLALLVLGAGWWGVSSLTSTSKETRYVLGSVATSTIIATISGSGQVAASTQLDIKPKISGDIIYIGVTTGQVVKAGTLIAEIDPTEAQKTVRDAQANLKSAQIALSKLQEPPTTLSLTQAQNQLSQAHASLSTQYSQTWSDVVNSFLDLPTIMSGLQDIDLGTGASGASANTWNIDYYSSQAGTYNIAASSYRNAAYNDYLTARTSYDQTFLQLKSMNSTPANADIETMLAATRTTTGLVATAVKSANDLLQFYTDQLTQNGSAPKALAATQIGSLNSYLGKAQSHLTELLGDITTLQNDKNSIQEKQQSLDQLQKGADDLDIESAQLSVTQRQNALLDAQRTLQDYYIRAPFDGTIGSLALHKFDTAGSGTTIATLATKQHIVDLSLNEVDAAKVAVGNKATLTFDAIEGLTLTGKLAEVNTVGSVSQGVVTYDIKITLDATDARVRPGMTANANIITAVHTDTLAVPSSAVKTQNGVAYVLVFNPPLENLGSAATPATRAPMQVPVEVGISDDTNTEISGLPMGRQIVVRTINAASALTQSAPSLFSGPGTRSTTGGGFRASGR